MCVAMMKKRPREDDDDAYPGPQPKRHHHHQSISSQFHDAMEDSKLGSGIGTSKLRVCGDGVTITDALSYLMNMKEKFGGVKTDKYVEFLKVMEEFGAKKIDANGVAGRVERVLNGHKDLISGFNTFLPKGHEISLSSENEQLVAEKTVNLDKAIAFTCKIKDRFGNNPYVYKSFLEILIMYKRRSKSILDVYKEVALLFQNDLDLLLEFHGFLPTEQEDETNDEDIKHNGTMNFNDMLAHPIGLNVVHRLGISFAGRHREGAGPHGFRTVSSCFKYKTSLRKHHWDDAHSPKSAIFEDGERRWASKMNEANRKDEERERKRHSITDRSVLSGSEDPSSRTASNYSEKVKFREKSIGELDLSKCESCTPSYRLLPMNYPRPSVNHRTELEAEVLNDDWVSIWAAHGDRSYKTACKSQYDKFLDCCEDERFKMDLLVESINSTIEQVKILLKLDHNEIGAAGIRKQIKERLTVSHLRCIEGLYGDLGLDMMDAVMDKPLRALPVVLVRLKQKQEELASCLYESNTSWAEA